MLNRRELLAASLCAVATPVFAQQATTTKDMPQRKAPTNNTNFPLTERQCWEIISGIRHPIMGTADKEGIPYALPISTVAFDGKIYFHGALGKGRKLENLKQNPWVSMVFVAPGHSEARGLDINNESVIVFGKVRFIENDEEKLKVARELLRFHNPGAPEAVIEKKMKQSGLAIVHTIQWLEVVPERITGKIIVHKHQKY